MATAAGVPGLAVLATGVVYGYLSKSILGLTKKDNFILRNRMLFVFAGIILLCISAGALRERYKATNDCSNSTYTTFGEHSPNQPCNSGTINNEFPAK